MGSIKKASAETKKAIPVYAGNAKSRGVSGKAAKENEIDAIFGEKRRSATEILEILAGDDGIGSRPSSQKKKKSKKVAPAIDEYGKVKAGKESRGAGKARKLSSSAAAAESGLSKPRKKTADGLTIFGEDELKLNNKDAGGTPLCPFDCECCY